MKISHGSLPSSFEFFSIDFHLLYCLKHCLIYAAFFFLFCVWLFVVLSVVDDS